MPGEGPDDTNVSPEKIFFNNRNFFQISNKI